MRVLILGAAGMLGHKLYQMYQGRFDTWATVRRHYSNYARFQLFDPERICGGVDVEDFDMVTRTIESIRPDVVVNCVGLVKAHEEAKDPVASININALFPHRLAVLCRAHDIRLIHISTDRVFNGRKGGYSEADPGDAYDLYGRTKLLGELDSPNTLTLRTAIIGREINSQQGLVEWFLTNRPAGSVRGFRRAIYTGFTTLAFAEIVACLIEDFPMLSGLYHVASEPISKYELLLRLRDAFNTEIHIEPYDHIHIDRSLNNHRFLEQTGLSAPSWKTMIHQLAQDATPYDQWHR
jgi:dTDP-4-dehydrorhamnose reductase